MSRKLETLSHDESVHSAAETMRVSEVGFLPVCDETGAVIGTLTDRDIAIRIVAAQRSSDTAVRDVMSPNVVACKQNDDVRVAEGLMKDHQVARIVCLDDAGKLAGIIGMSDLAKREDAEHLSATLHDVKQNEASLS
jgi:CBS domain-containing protein